MTRTHILIALLVGASFGIPGYAVAKENDIDQKYLRSEVERSDENVANEWDAYQDADPGSSIAASNCQLLVAAEVSVAALASTSALAVITDEDEVAITEFPRRLFHLGDALDAESATSSCDTPIGPVLLDITTSSGWGSPAPHGTLMDAVSALGGGKKGGSGGLSNDLDQKRIKSGVELDENVHNEWYLDQYDYGNSALSAANCQGILAARVAILGVATSTAEARIEDSDSVVITESDGLGTRDVGFDEVDGARTRAFTLANNHDSTSSCNQPIESITIAVRPAMS